MPTLAILGFFEGGRQVMTMAEDPAWVAQLAQDHPRAAPADAAVIDQMVVWVRYAFVGALLAVLTARLVRWHWERRRGVIRLTYPNGRVVEIVRGVSVLEASRMAGIPHASVFGGRGRCSTCRIRGVHRPMVQSDALQGKRFSRASRRHAGRVPLAQARQ